MSENLTPKSCYKNTPPKTKLISIPLSRDSTVIDWYVGCGVLYCALLNRDSTITDWYVGAGLLYWTSKKR